MKKNHTFVFDVEESKVLYDLIALVEEFEATGPEHALIKTLDSLSDRNKDYKITVTVEEV